MVNLTGGQLPRGIATIWRRLNRDAYDGTLGLHSQAVSRQGFRGVVWFLLHVVVEPV
jgi:hypothetical protein